MIVILSRRKGQKEISYKFRQKTRLKRTMKVVFISELRPRLTWALWYQEGE